MKTKNRKAEPVLKAAKPAEKSTPARANVGKLGPKGPPVKELQRGTVWMIENFEGDHEVVVDQASMQHLVCIINCKNSTVRIQGKVKNVSIDSCERVNMICGDVVSTVEFVNSERCQFQTTGNV